MKLFWMNPQLKVFLFRLILLGLLLGILLASCEKKSPKPVNLTLNASVFYVPLGGSTPIYIQQGSGKYQIITSDDDMISTESPTKSFFGQAIQTFGLKKGKTSLQVHDLRSGQQSEVVIHVVDPFIHINLQMISMELEGADAATTEAILKTAPRFAPLGQDIHIVLQNNAQQQALLFTNEFALEVGAVKHQGTYRFDFEDDGSSQSVTGATTVMGANSGITAKLFLDFPELGTIQLPMLFAYEALKVRFQSFASSVDASLSPSILMSHRFPFQNVTAIPGPLIAVPFLLYFDKTDEIHTAYPAVRKAFVFQHSALYPPEYHPLSIGSGLLE